MLDTLKSCKGSVGERGSMKLYILVAPVCLKDEMNPKRV